MDATFALCCALLYGAVMLLVTGPQRPSVEVRTYRVASEQGDSLVPAQHLWVTWAMADGRTGETWVGRFRSMSAVEQWLAEAAQAEQVQLVPRLVRWLPQAGPDRLVLRGRRATAAQPIASA